MTIDDAGFVRTMLGRLYLSLRSMGSQNWLVELYPNRHNLTMKPVQFLGDSLKCVRDFPDAALQDAGRQLD